LVAASLCGAVVTLTAPSRVCAQAETIVVDIDALVHEEPDDRSRVVLRVRAGEELQVVSRSGKWVRVQLPRGTGWILERVTRTRGGSSSLAGTGERDSHQVTVVDAYADIKAGPGDAYLGIKRVFKGDMFEVVKTNDDGTWVQIRIGGDLGWIRADQTLRADAVAGRGGEGRGGKDGGDGGGPLGASSNFDEGELTAPDPELSQLAEGATDGPEKPSGPGATGLWLRLGGLYEDSSQSFDSDSTNFRLDLYETGSSLFGADVSAGYFFLDYVGAAVDYSVAFGTPITVAFEETGAIAELKNSTQRLHGRVIGRYPFGTGNRVSWVGASLGGFYQSYAIQETTIPVFLPNTYTGLRVGVDGAAVFGPVSLWGSGWWGVLGSLDQGEMTSGDEQSVTTFGAEMGAEFELTTGIGVYARLLYDRAKTDFTGIATRDEGISQAVNRDQFLTIGAGVSWRPDL